MKSIETLFHLHRAKSSIYDAYDPGEVPYVGNGLTDNAVAGLVEPLDGDKVFRYQAIAVSAFCEATVQAPPFIACGRAGNGMTVLEPRLPMSIAQMAYIAAYINLAVRWRFSWYRQTTSERLRRILIPSNVPARITFAIRSALPDRHKQSRTAWRLNLKQVALGDLFEIVSGDYHSLSDLAPGSIPVVSCGDANNGVSGLFDVSDHIYRDRLTVAFNGMNTLTAKYHPYRFAAKDDVAVCQPKKPLQITTEIFIQMMINRERWRYSYYRKCFAEKLRMFKIELPSKRGRIDEDTMAQVVESSSYWRFLKQHIT